MCQHGDHERLTDADGLEADSGVPNQRQNLQYEHLDTN